ncbi:glutamyl-tRNA reductase [Alicyclobacillus sp.]|uniref:glutamyl-tRNA reductase n=1 Tax=Alicyclobacillus sp. TaxID=61169 RepID=UPI0025C05A87|nr:glutamyl-tRNA reductase [Alicyclobacillus sp.]MCL6517742.1 glutamyl-tRNA reductase [Alicyclobacillus sp.]
MHIIAVGLNHRSAPVEIRERVSVPEDALEAVLSAFRNTRTLLESVIVSTCNRTEVYAVVGSARAGRDYLRTWFARRGGDEAARHLYIHEDQEAARHLMRVASGLDSLVLGETQILGQVRDAYLAAEAAGNTGALLNQLFRRAIRVGKRAQAEAGIGQNPVSVSYAAVQLVRKVFGDLRGKRVLVVGAGKMSRLTAQHLFAAGIAQMQVCNRTLARAEALAAVFGATPLPWTALEDGLAQADVVISSTGAEGFVIGADMARRALARRGRRPVVVVDIAVPRDVDPAVGELGQVYLYDIDDLEGVVAANLAERERLAREVERMIAEALREYGHWLAEQEVVPLIAAIRARGEAIQASVMDSIGRKMPGLSDRERELLQKHTMSIVNQLLRDPVKNMKELAISGEAPLDVFARVFGVTDEDLRRHRDAALWPEAEAGAGGGLSELVRHWGDALRRDGRPRDADAPGALRPALR